MTDATKYTKWHKLVEAINHGSYSSSKLQHDFFDKNADNFDKPLTTPLFVFTLRDDVSYPVADGAFIDLCTVLSEIPTPFDKFIIEIPFNNKRYFLINKRINPTELECSLFAIDPKGICYVILTHCRFAIVNGSIEVGNAVWYFEDHTLYQHHCENVSITLTQFLLTLSTRGVEREKVKAPAALNKKRERKGKPRVPDVTFIKIGHYYTKGGERCAYDERKPVRVHWRRGHMRGVWCGSGSDRRLEQRYIFPCLVNYQPGDNEPKQPIRVLQ